MTLRLKLTMGSIVVILLANSLLSLVNVAYLERAWLAEVQTRVRIDLNSARASYMAHADSIAQFLTAAAMEPTLSEGIHQPDRADMRRRLSELSRAGQMDILTLLDSRGRTIHRSHNPGRAGDDQSSNPLVAAAIRSGNAAVGTCLLAREQLLAEGPDLAAKAEFELLPTPAARPAADHTRSDGMVLGAAVPVLGSDRKLVGFLVGGNLLNRRYSIVDQIRQQVFLPGVYEGRQTGSVTIFQGDLRIATNVTQDDGSRAVGTRMSSDVYQRVLVQGETWDGPAFVVNDWYITAYEPIRDPDERIIGALYVGLLRAPFAHQRNVVAAVVLLVTLVVTVACLLLLFFVTKLVLRPIDQVVAMAQRVTEGDLSARTGVRPPGEMGVLCDAIDRMADAVAQREQDRNAAAQQQLGRSEKLASIGRLAAGVAHEINNPLTGVLTFAHLLRDKPKMDAEDKEDLDLIIHETTRAAEIVRNLLDFARERAAIKERLCINDVIARTIRLIRNQKAFDQIVFEENFANDLPEIDGNLNQLQQVFLNLSLNACEAMPKGGSITINTSTHDGRVVVEVIDNGCGIKKAHLDRIFEPFFTTKPVGKGTGLGLAVSYGIIDQHGGTLEVDTEEGKGSKFTITLPTATGRRV
jgi:two-component system, NtrC family, sensor kinase